MKKLVLSLAVFIAVSASFTSCNIVRDTPILPPMNGFWECVEIRAGGGGIVSLPTPISPELLKFFSVNYAGAMTGGVFLRVGTDAGDLTGLLSSIGATAQDQVTWRDFLTGGSFVFTPQNATSGTITHTARGISTTYLYSMPNRDTLVLREVIATAGGPAVGGVLDMIGLIFGTQVNNAVYIEYVYRRNDRIANLFPKR